MPNSEVKRNSADGSVGLPHVRVGHRQALISTSSLIGRSHYRVLFFIARFFEKSRSKNLEFYVDFQSGERIIRTSLEC